MTKVERGGDTTKHNTLSVKLDDMAWRQLEKVKKHYGFKDTTELVHALIKRASMSVDLE